MPKTPRENKLAPVLAFDREAEKRRAYREELLQRFKGEEREDFAGELALARVYWRQYRELVEAEEFPATLLVNGEDEEPGVEPAIHPDDPALEQHCLALAEECLKNQNKRA